MVDLSFSKTFFYSFQQIGKCQKKFLQGDFTDLNIWSQPLSDELIKTFASGCVDKMFSLTNPDVAAWDQRTYYAEEFVTNYTMTRKDLCTPKGTWCFSQNCV